jgi:hypothetical protein
MPQKPQRSRNDGRHDGGDEGANVDEGRAQVNRGMALIRRMDEGPSDPQSAPTEIGSMFVRRQGGYA